MKKSFVGLIILAALTGIYLYTHVDFNSQNDKDLPTVSIASVKQENIAVPLQAIGNVQAYAQVSVQPQVAGELLSVHFQQGQLVKPGQLLFQIDPRTFQIQLQTAEATLARDEATALNAKLTYERYQKIFNKKYLSAQDLDQAKANSDSAAATVKADIAAVNNAKLQLSYCKVIAPIGGRTGNLLINAGNIVNSTTTLVTINQLQPVYVSFSIPEKDLLAVKNISQQQKIPVTAHINKKLNESGELTFINNAIDNTTGTIQLKATFNNNDLQLWPGQFVEVTLPTEHLDNALIIPAIAIQQGQQGAFVYVLNKNNTVNYRAIVVGPTTENGVVITEGLKADERVVTKGQLRLTDGTQVSIEKSS